MGYYCDYFLKDGPKIPCAFDTYDANDDDVITRNEFFQATSGLPQTTSATIFIRMDNDRKLFSFLVISLFLSLKCLWKLFLFKYDNRRRVGR